MPDVPPKPSEKILRPIEQPVSDTVAPRPEAEPTAEAREPVPEAAPEPRLEPERSSAEASGPRRRPAPSVQAQVADSMTKQIEEFLSEDLTDVFLGMTPEKQTQFKAKGEETASRIRQMLASASVNARKVFELIRDWLKLIPGVNRFFLEQEAKIKTDKILKLKP